MLRRFRSVSRPCRIDSFDSFESSTTQVLRSVYYNNVPSLVVASIFSWRSLAVSTSSFLHATINLRPPSVTVSTHTFIYLQRRRFPIPRYAKRPDVALYAVGLLFLLPTPYSQYCTLKVSLHNSLWQPPAAHSDKRLRPQKSSRAQRRLNALTPVQLR